MFNNNPKIKLCLIVILGGAITLWSSCRKTERAEHVKEEEPSRIEEKVKEKKPGPVKEELPSSLALIAEDEKAGILDKDTAWILRFQRLFEPEKLPKKYQSPKPIKCGTPVFKAFNREKVQLKPETIDRLHPYLVRPDHPDSIFNLRENQARASRNSSSGYSNLLFAQKEKRPKGLLPLDVSDKILLWYQRGGEGTAEEARRLLVDYDMYNEFLRIMKEEPPSDALLTFGDRNRNIGGDGRLDIYLVSATNVQGDDGWCKVELEDSGSTTNMPSPSHILINGGLSGDDLGAALAHELFHAFQHAWDAYEDEWWSEGTAVWAEDHIDSSWDTEHIYIKDAFNESNNSLISIDDNAEDHMYGIYIFPYYLTKVRYPGNDLLIGKIWASCKSQNALDAVESNLSGDFKNAFKEFALLNYEENLLSDCSENTHGYPESLFVYSEHDACEIEIDKSKPVAINIPPLGACYMELENKVPKDTMPNVLIDLREILKNSDLSIQAVITTASGDERCEDWSEKEERSFCTNFEEEDFAFLKLTIANHNRENVQKAFFQIYVDAGECFKTGVIVHFKDTYYYKHSSRGEDTIQTHHYEATVRFPFTTDGFSAIPGAALPGLGPYGSATYQCQTPIILSFKAEEVFEYKDKREVKTGSAPQVFTPGIPSMTFTREQDQKQFTIFSPFLVPYYFDIDYKNVVYAVIPEVDIRYNWEDGKKRTLALRPVLGKKVNPPQSKMEIPKEFLVTFSRGAHHFGGEGNISESRSDEHEITKIEKEYRWEIFRGKAPKKKNP
ncbi:MAG: hypothetical protein J7L72_05600 [Candidatus Aminicenantes bacterium]|nr:hypothetical protein [Candidatus Aminicenantes bacterium]